MQVFWCKKHGFVPLNGQLAHCLAQASHTGCKNLLQLPTEHPKGEHKYKYRKKERRQIKRQLQGVQ